MLPFWYAVMDTTGIKHRTKSEAIPWVMAFATSSPKESFMLSFSFDLIF